MPLESLESLRGSFGNKLRLQLRCGQIEGHIHLRSRLRLGMPSVVISAVNGLVEAFVGCKILVDLLEFAVAPHQIRLQPADLLLGLLAFVLDTAGGVLFGKILYRITGKKANGEVTYEGRYSASMKATSSMILPIACCRASRNRLRAFSASS